MEEKLSDINISGSGKVNGGRYNEVRIRGTAEVDGNIQCNKYKCSGSSIVNGNVETKTIVISGSTKIKGDLDTEEITVSGISSILGNVNAKKVKISGSSDIGGSLHTEDIQIAGSVSINDDCEAEDFHARGGFEIGGLLNAGNIDIELYGGCKVKDIGGENIKVRLGKERFFAKMFNIFMNSKGLEANTIEGDDIFLENTTAKIVRGNNVTIGDNCNIETVEYRNEINIDSTSKTVCKKID